MKNIKLAPSVLSADFTRLASEIHSVEEGGADWIHLDVMDGRFVPNITFGPIIVKAVKRLTDLPLDVHLMIVEPEKHIDDFRAAGADWITVHLEAVTKPESIIESIKQSGARAGISIKPKTPIKELKPILDKIDLVLVMSVDPGAGGHSFIPSCLDKVTEMAEMRDESGANFKISVDGGVNGSNAADIVKAGADILIAGSSVYHSDNPAEALQSLRNMVESA